MQVARLGERKNRLLGVRSVPSPESDAEELADLLLVWLRPAVERLANGAILRQDRPSDDFERRGPPPPARRREDVGCRLLGGGTLEGKGWLRELSGM